MIQLTINGTVYEYPESRDSPSWGEDATAWAQAVTDVLADVVGTGDILTTTATVANNISSATNVAGLSFDPTLVRASIVEYSIYRVTTGSGATEAVEVGTMYLTYKSTANVWDLAIVGATGAGVTFSITTAGQIQYVSTNFTGLSYVGTMKFRARAFPI